MTCDGGIPNVLSIAGSDPSGGAGIQADLRTFTTLGAYGCAVVTALTAQNTREITAVLPVPADFLREQLEAVFSDVRIDAVKVGMLGTAEAVGVVAGVLRKHRPERVVLDPVQRASTGTSLLDANAIDALRDELIPLVTLVTPNAMEAGALLGVDAPRSVSEACSAAAALVAGGAAAALVTGGHLSDERCSIDVLHDGRTTRQLVVSRIPGAARHGTGCTLSSAIATFLAHGRSLGDACAGAQRFVADAIARSANLRVGGGAAPVNQLT